MVCHQSDQSVIGRAKHFREFKAFRHERSLRFCGDSDYVEMFLLVLGVPSFLFAYFTIAHKHGVNEVKISFCSLFAYLSLH